MAILGEVKARKTAWSDLYRWLEPVSVLFLRKDNHPPLVVMSMTTFEGFAKGQVNCGTATTCRDMVPDLHGIEAENSILG